MIVAYCANTKCRRPMSEIEMHSIDIGKHTVYICENCLGKARGIIRDWLDGAQIKIIKQNDIKFVHHDVNAE